MIRKLIHWAVENRLVVTLLALVLVAVGGHAFFTINVEAYPDPAPAIIEVIAEYPGASAEEVERQVTIPLEVALAGMPGLQQTRTKSLFGLSHTRNQFDYSTDNKQARIEVLNRLKLAQLPSSVTPQIAPTSPTGEIYRYVIDNPQDEQGNEIYSLADLKSLQDWTLNREFRRIPRIADVVGFGGEIKLYEVRPDPERLKQFGISLDQLESAITASNLNAGGDYLLRSETVQAVRGLGLIGDGQDPYMQALQQSAERRAARGDQQLIAGTSTYDKLFRRAERDLAIDARNLLRSEEQRRLREIRQIVLAATNNVPIRVGDVVEGGRRVDRSQPYTQGVVVASHTRFGRVSLSYPEVDEQTSEEKLDDQGNRIWTTRDDTVQGIVLLRKGEQSLPALVDVKAKITELNDTPGKLLPGVSLRTFYDRTKLINRTTETVHENLIVGIALVSLVLLVFLNNFRTALIVAINIPLALLFAFAVLNIQGKSANLLSLGAVDFGIIVDSSVIMVESIYRRLGTRDDSYLPLTQRIMAAAGEVERSLFYSTLIMVAALLPLFTMSGPEGRIFGPMADAYAYALGGALLLALTLSPVLCRTLLGKVKEAKDNILVRGVKWLYQKQLEFALRHRLLVLGIFGLLVAVTAVALPFMGREFMPELEEGNVYVRGTFPASVSLNLVTEKTLTAQRLLQVYPEAASILAQLGRPDDGTDPTGFYNAEINVPLKPEAEWPKVVERRGLSRLFGAKRRRTKNELVESMNRNLAEAVVGVDWNFSQYIRDNVMEVLSGVKGENSIKIFGPDLDELEKVAGLAAGRLATVPGIKNPGVFTIKGQTNLELAIDREKCSLWNVSIADVQDALQTAVGGKAFTEMVEGERTFDITLRWPERLRVSEDLILDIPVDVVKNRVTNDSDANSPGSPKAGLHLSGTSLAPPTTVGNIYQSDATAVPRRRLRDLVTPVNEKGFRDPGGKFTRSGASTIYREQGQRFIAVKFSVRDRDLAGTVAEAKAKTKDLFKSPYRAEWSGEFQEMEEAVERLAIVASLAMVLIVVLLYLALLSLLDVATVMANVIVICIGGIWALFLTGSNFNISAGVGFISILGVGIMNGLLMVSSFNSLRAHGEPLSEAIVKGVDKLIRPLVMTALAAGIGMLPAALATGMGSQTQKPLAIVVVGGMSMTLLLINLVPVLYSFYGNREPRADVAGMGH